VQRVDHFFALRNKAFLFALRVYLINAPAIVLDAECKCGAAIWDVRCTVNEKTILEKSFKPAENRTVFLKKWQSTGKKQKTKTPAPTPAPRTELVELAPQHSPQLPANAIGGVAFDALGAAQWRGG
jgi:hypothetical protein